MNMERARITNMFIYRDLCKIKDALLCLNKTRS